MKIGIFIGGVYYTYSAAVLGAMERFAAERGITLYIFGCFETPEKKFLHAEGEKSIIYIQDLDMLDGIVIAGDTLGKFGMKDALLDRIRREANCPVVCLRERQDAYYNVLVDNINDMYEMTHHFIQEHGFRDICFVTGMMSMWDARERLEGYQKAMKEAGLFVGEDMIFYGNYWMNQAAQIVDRFTCDRGKLPQAIICSNDYEAISVCMELKRRGIRVPEDICVSGFDDLTGEFDPDISLSTMAIPYQQMAQRALETVCMLAEGRSVSRFQKLRGQMRLRHSCGCCRDALPEQTDNCTNGKFRNMAKGCIYMTADFESALNEEECMKWAGWHVNRLGAENCFICLGHTDSPESEENLSQGRYLRLYLNEQREPALTCIPIPDKRLLPDAYLPMLEKRTNLFLPLHFNNEVFGYCILQMKPGGISDIDERFEFFCLNLGNALKKNQMYRELFSVKDVMQMYLKDPLTGIYNRRGFERKLPEICDISQKMGVKLAVVSIDMDGLKYINDHFGHLTGDKSLVSFAHCLCGALHEHEFCARMGGDEFEAVLLLDSENRKQRFEQELAHRLACENAQIEQDYGIDASVGICEVEENNTLMEYFRLADEKMYRIKRSKKNCRE